MQLYSQIKFIYSEFCSLTIILLLEWAISGNAVIYESVEYGVLGFSESNKALLYFDGFRCIMESKSISTVKYKLSFSGKNESLSCFDAF